MSILTTIQTTITGPWFKLHEKHIIKCIIFSAILCLFFVLQLMLELWVWYMNQWTKIISSRHYYRTVEQLRKTKIMIEVWINEFMIWSILRENIQVIHEGECLPAKKNKQIVISNHRSIIDYSVIQSQFGSELVIFASWGNLMKYPSLTHFWGIVRNDENYAVSISKFKNYHGSESIVIFPEVNIFTPEIKTVERKLMKSRYKALPVLHNVLYPRFKTFVNLIQAKSNEASTRWTKMLEQLIMPYENIPTHRSNLVDLTLIYYTISLKDSGQYKLEQTTPAFWDIWSLEAPLIVWIHTKNHELERLMTKKPKHLEAWLESQWCSKDRLIDTLELEVEVV